VLADDEAVEIVGIERAHRVFDAADGRLEWRRRRRHLSRLGQQGGVETVLRGQGIALPPRNDQQQRAADHQDPDEGGGHR
jgi:hypothetical protein